MSTSKHNGFAIRAIREARGLTVQDLCNRLNLSAPALRNIELEHKQTRVEHLQRIADALDVPVQAIARVPLTEWAAVRPSEQVPA